MDLQGKMFTVEELMYDFLNYLTDEQHVSDDTAWSYLRDVSQFLKEANVIGFDNCKNLNHAQIQEYMCAMGNDGKSNSTILRHSVSIRNFCAYLVKKGLLDENPAEGLCLPKQLRKVPVVLGTDEINRLLAAPDTSDEKGLRDKAMLELMYATGMKVSEIISLELGDVNLAESAVVCRSGDKVRVVPIGAAAVRAIENYVINSRPLMTNGKTDVKTLFVNHWGNPMTRQGFWKIVKSYIAAANIGKSVTPQTLRHSFAVHLLSNGADVEAVAQMLGCNGSVCMREYGMPDKNLRRIYNRAHPRA